MNQKYKDVSYLKKCSLVVLFHEHNIIDLDNLLCLHFGDFARLA